MSGSLDQFKESMALATALKQLERDNYPALAKLKEQPLIKGLRGGAAVLMVAAFEYFIRSLFEMNIARLNSVPVNIDFTKLPPELKVKTVFHGLKIAMDGPAFSAKLPKVDRINEVMAACRLLINSHIDPTTFSETGSNPNGETVKSKFKEVGIPDIFGKIKHEFEQKWKEAVADNFIKDKLDEIVRTRHVVAHTADTLNITRASQNEAIKFLEILAALLEKELDSHITNLLRIAKK